MTRHDLGLVAVAFLGLWLLLRAFLMVSTSLSWTTAIDELPDAWIILAPILLGVGPVLLAASILIVKRHAIAAALFSGGSATSSGNEPLVSAQLIFGAFGVWFVSIGLVDLLNVELNRVLSASFRSEHSGYDFSAQGVKRWLDRTGPLLQIAVGTVLFYYSGRLGSYWQRVNHRAA